MAFFSLIQFEMWDEHNVAGWLNGLDDGVHSYIPSFIKDKVDGRKLLMLEHSDLDKLGITKLGHQELILEGVDLLKALRYTFETENLQHLALQLGCKARSLHNEILARNGENDPNRANIQLVRHRGQLSISVLSSVCDIMSTLKTLTSWLDRAPFETIHGITLLRNSLVKLGLELVTVAQRESGISEVENAIVKTCQGMTEYCDELVLNMKESLVVQPAALEMATIRKKQGEELGMNIQSLYFGIHVIGCIKELSPADLCSKIEKGDEVIQVNNQTVLGWQLAKLVAALKENPKEVTMLLKKRPRHTNPYGNVQNKRLMGSRHVPSVATLPKTMKKRRSKDGDKPPRPTLQEYVTSSVPSGDIHITKEPPEETNDGNDTDNDVFRSGSESPQFTLPVIVDAKQRRATVSGGSPTFERPSLIVEDLDPAPLRPKSQAINLIEKEAAMAGIRSTENSLQRKVFETREKKRLRSQSEDGGNNKQTETSQVSDSAASCESTSQIKQEDTINSKSEPAAVVDTEVTDDGGDSADADVTFPEGADDTTPVNDTQPMSYIPFSHESQLGGSENQTQEVTVTKPMTFVSDGPPGRKNWNKQQKIVSTEVAGNSGRSDQPQLMRIKRLDWQQISEMETKMGDDEVFVKPQKKVGFSDDLPDADKVESFTHIVVGGVVQKIPTEKARLNSANESPTVKMRNKTLMSKTKLDRRVSCKDLGKGDCEGWLYKRKQKDRTLSKHWDKRWCVLKNSNLFYYKNKEDLKAEGVIHLPAFQVSPAPKLKTKKSAFKIHNGGTTFYFASERQDDMSKWMNKMGLAAISYDASSDATTINTSSLTRPAKFSISSFGTKNGYSESEDEEEDVPGNVLSGSVLSLASALSVENVGASTEALHSMLRSIQAQDLTIDGQSKVQQRRSQCTLTHNLAGSIDQAEVDRLRRLHSLQRTLRAKEQELQEIEELMSKPLTSTELTSFLEVHDSHAPVPK